MKNPFHLFGLGMSLFCLGFNLYAAWWLVRRLALRPWGRLLAIESALLLSVLYPLSRAGTAALPGSLENALLRAGFFVLGASFIVFWSLALFDLLLAAAGRLGAGWARGRAAGLACLAVACALVLLAAWQGGRPAVIKRLEVPVRGLPTALDGFTVLQISDLHLGRMTGLERLEKIAAHAVAVKPDLIALTGDFSERRERMPDGTCEALKQMTARRAKVAVLGNHDMFTGGGPAAEFFEGCGFKMLRGQVYEPVPGLLVGGVDDLRRAGGAAVGTIAASLDRSKPLLFLSHQPQGFDEITAAGSGLVLSGHTHDGQIFPFSLLERGLFKYFYGLYRAGDFHVYVTSGAGTWGPPLRLFTRSELPLITLRRAD